MARTARIGAAAGAILTLLLSPALATAGDADDLSARELSDQATDHLLDAKSLRIELADRSEETRSSPQEPTSMDLSLDQDGNCAGFLEMGADGGRVELVKRGDEVWLKPDADFWKTQLPGGEGEAAADLFGDRFIHGSTQDELLSDMAEVCSLDSFQRQVEAGAPDGTVLSKGEETTVDDTKVVPLRGEEDGTRATLYVTSDAPHRLVRATQQGDGTDLTVAFSDYDKPVPSRTPPAEESVDVGRLEEQLRDV